jgi:hypothetical protein
MQNRKTAQKIVFTHNGRFVVCISQWRRIAFIVGVKEAQIKYDTYITTLTPQITSKDNGLLRKAEPQ